MAEINWGLLQTPDYFGDAMKYQRAGQQQRGTEQGGAALGAGDYLGAAKAYGSAGMTDQATQALRLNAQQTEADTAAKLERAKTAIGVAAQLEKVPLGQRKQALMSAYPLFQAAKIDTTPFDGLTEDQLTDQNLRLFSGNLAKEAEQYTLTPGAARYDTTGRMIASQPLAPQFHTVGEGQSLVRVGGDQQPQPAAPPAAPPPGDWLQAVSSAAPDAQVTSGLRTPEHNAAVGGQPNSKHLSGQAVDLVPKPGETMAQLYERVRSVPGVRAINEGDHVHVQATGVAAPQAPPASGGAQVVAQGAPKATKAPARPATAGEKAAYGIPADVPAQYDPNTGKIDVISGVAARAKPPPAAITSGYTANQAAIAQIDAAIASIKKNPGALGLKNHLGDAVNQRLDPNGVETRASVANIGSKVLHDRSGAAVTLAESPRLMPFTPQVTDTADAAVKKLQGLRQQYVNANTEMEVAFGADQGYAPLVGGQHPPGAPAAQPAPQRPTGPAKRVGQPAQQQAGGLPPQARSQLKVGHITTFANGQSWTLRNGQPVQVKN